MREGFSQEPLVPLCRYKRAIEDRAKIGSCIEGKDHTNQFAFSAHLQLLTDRRGRHPPGDRAMKQIIYAMQFKGQGGPGASPNEDRSPDEGSGFPLPSEASEGRGSG